MKKLFKPLFVICSLLLISFVSFASNDDSDVMFTKEKILEILSKETILYYVDGQTQLGSLFGNEHRLYITIDQVPKILKDAIVSAEDESFYTNIGIDPRGIARATFHNFFYGTRQGASTITQQTVKNLYGRSHTNLLTKFQEMLNAFKLEKKFSKDQILEFYLNQFHVTGNGRGVGIAAKYYFNKNVEDLNLVEAAFIAGSVKGPEKYTPFTKNTPERQAQAKTEAFIRKNYVLDRLLKSNKITQAQYDIAVKQQVPFKQGKFQFNELSVSQIVQRQLSRPDILTALGVNTVDEIASKGFHITTTIDASTQRAAQYGLRQNLSRIQMILNGFSLEPSTNFVNVQSPELYAFYTGKVDSKITDAHHENMIVNLGIQKCTIDTQGLNRVAEILDQIGHVGIDRAKSNFLETIQIGDPILVSIKNISADSSLECDIETRPRVQGGAIAIDKGQILALVGGFSPNEYNRAVFAQRQPGSTFKIPTYYAGLQLGWTVLDTLSNIRDVFVWQKQFYYPRPDHKPPTLETTIVGASTRSENIASIWFMRHLTDKMSYSQYEELLRFLNITSLDGNMGQTLQNIVNKFNATPYDEFNIREGILDKLKNDVSNDLNVMHDPRLKVFVRTLHYGNGFYNESHKVQKTFVAKTKGALKEKEFRLHALKNNLIRWKEVRAQANSALQILQSADGKNNEIVGSFALSDNGEKLVYISVDSWKPENISNLIEPLNLKYISFADVRAKIVEHPSLASAENVYLDGVVPISLIDSFDKDLETKYSEVQQAPPLEKLYWNADFRYSLGMYYTASMVNGMGVQEPLSWVPSFPLGTNTISLAELAVIYQTLLTGKTYKFYNTQNENQLLIIKRIEDGHGNLLWEYQSHETQYIDPEYSAPMLNVLRNVVLAGTGYSLNWDIILRSSNPSVDRQLSPLKIRVPNFGKTGTTNDFTNGTYIGFLPYPVDKDAPLSAENAITIATYIGYDSNQPMQKNGYKVYGGAAIPAWQEIALSIIKSKNYADKINWQTTLGDRMIPFDYGFGLSDITVPVNSNVNMKFGAQDDNDLLEKNIYLNDYSDTGQNFLRLHLNGGMSDNVFIPKRKVAFFMPKTQGLPQVPKATSFTPVESSTEQEDQ